jgi:hypothetical protein
MLILVWADTQEPDISLADVVKMDNIAAVAIRVTNDQLRLAPPIDIDHFTDAERDLLRTVAENDATVRQKLHEAYIALIGDLNLHNFKNPTVNWSAQ